jgi:hypothetical protein
LFQRYKRKEKIEDAYGPGLTEDEYQDIAMDITLNNAMKIIYIFVEEK